jgi:pimeloyl-[acyl-carrier protein] methyl ester esterase
VSGIILGSHSLNESQDVWSRSRSSYLDSETETINVNRKLPQIVLLPGMDGTGELFADFIAALSGEFETKAVRYSTDICQSYSELAGLIRGAVPADAPFVLVAESFSTPLAIHYAATKPPNLKGLVLCAGFASTPVRGWKRFVVSILAPIAFRFTLPTFACRLLLVGAGAQAFLVDAVRSTISSVQPNVLADRLRSLLACDFRAHLAQVDLPILYIRAEHDRLVDVVCLKEILRIKPETSVIAMSGPHLLLQREPVRTAEIVVGFAGQFEIGKE